MARNTADPRSTELKTEMARHFEKCEADYRTEDWCSVVYEDEQVVVIADHKGHEFSGWSQDAEMSAKEFSTTMHSLARQLCDYDWCVSYPVVFDKTE